MNLQDRVRGFDEAAAVLSRAQGRQHGALLPGTPVPYAQELRGHEAVRDGSFLSLSAGEQRSWRVSVLTKHDRPRNTAIPRAQYPALLGRGAWKRVYKGAAHHAAAVRMRGAARLADCVRACNREMQHTRPWGASVDKCCPLCEE